VDLSQYQVDDFIVFLSQKHHEENIKLATEYWRRQRRQPKSKERPVKEGEKARVKDGKHQMLTDAELFRKFEKMFIHHEEHREASREKVKEREKFLEEWKRAKENKTTKTSFFQVVRNTLEHLDATYSGVQREETERQYIGGRRGGLLG
jgi:hypothetical protein